MHPLNKVAVGVDQRKAAPGGHVLPGETFEEPRLANAGLADDVGVEQTVGLLDPEPAKLAMEVGFREIMRCRFRNAYPDCRRTLSGPHGCICRHARQSA